MSGLVAGIRTLIVSFIGSSAATVASNDIFCNSGTTWSVVRPSPVHELIYEECAIVSRGVRLGEMVVSPVDVIILTGSTLEKYEAPVALR